MQAQENETDNLVDELVVLRDGIAAQASDILAQYAQDPEALSHHPSALNLAHYLAMRRHDLRRAQQVLAEIGASSLGRCEAHVMASLERLIQLLSHGYQPAVGLAQSGFPDVSQGRAVLEQNTQRLFGPISASRRTRIMVTLPRKAAWDAQLVNELVANGMNCARINCAHDDREIWQAMVQNLQTACREHNKACAILMDLAGQKIRTHLAVNEAARVKIRPSRDGRIKQPAQVVFIPQGREPVAVDEELYQAQLPLPEDVYARLLVGDVFSFKDANGKKREIELTAKTSKYWVGRCDDKATLDARVRFKWRRKQLVGKETIGGFVLEHLPQQHAQLTLYCDDRVLLCGQASLNAPSENDPAGQSIARIGMSHPEILAGLQLGQWVWFDDGKIGAVVEHLDGQGAWLQVRHAHAQGATLRSDKGINFPDTELALPALTQKDLSDLDFIATHADMVGFSFVQTRQDMDQLMQALAQRNASHLSIIAKIETKVAVRNLPEILLSCLGGRQRLGVMIARGDLAIELGGERMAEIQEELLWLCEAAHVPVIWATQVLESLAKTGLSTRAELTDAAMSARAECVMLNKGPYIVRAVNTLDTILTRMQDHQYKKASQLRALHW